MKAALTLNVPLPLDIVIYIGIDTCLRACTSKNFFQDALYFLVCHTPVFYLNLRDWGHQS